jgi:hypothetical protein
MLAALAAGNESPDREVRAFFWWADKRHESIFLLVNFRFQNAADRNSSQNQRPAQEEEG